jgi:WD40 repeat protein
VAEQRVVEQQKTYPPTDPEGGVDCGYNRRMTVAYSFDGEALVPLPWEPRRTPRWASWRHDGAGAILCGNGGSALLFDGQRLHSLQTGTRQNLRGAAWSPDGKTALLVGNRGAVLRLNGEAFEEVGPATSENLRRVAWHPAGDYALIVGNAGTVLRYDAATGDLGPLPGDRAHTLRAVAFRPDGAFALVGAYASRWAGYPRPHGLYRCDGRFLQALLGSEDEDDFVAVDWSADGVALAAGYHAGAGAGAGVNKLLLYDGSTWRGREGPAGRAVLGAGWHPDGRYALLAGEAGLLARIDRNGGLTELNSSTTDNLTGPFWRPDGSMAILLKGPGDKVYTV